MEEGDIINLWHFTAEEEQIKFKRLYKILFYLTKLFDTMDEKLDDLTDCQKGKFIEKETIKYLNNLIDDVSCKEIRNLLYFFCGHMYLPPFDYLASVLNSEMYSKKALFLYELFCYHRISFMEMMDIIKSKINLNK